MPVGTNVGQYNSILFSFLSLSKLLFVWLISCYQLVRCRLVGLSCEATLGSLVGPQRWIVQTGTEILWPPPKKKKKKCIVEVSFQQNHHYLETISSYIVVLQFNKSMACFRSERCFTHILTIWKSYSVHLTGQTDQFRPTVFRKCLASCINGPNVIPQKCIWERGRERRQDVSATSPVLFQC